MAAKLVVVLALTAVAHCSVVPIARADADYTSFAYDVADPYTGDFKSQVETRIGGNVQGQYSLLESDGTKRTVDYAADDINGFNAVVRKDPAVIAAPVVAAAPAVVAARTIAAPAVVASAPAVVAARTIAAPAVVASAPAVVAARTVAAPAVVASAPAVVAARTIAAPAVVASAPGIVAARTIAAPAVVASGPAVVAARTIAAPAVFSNGLHSTVYSSGHSVIAGSPLSYSVPLNYW